MMNVGVGEGIGVCIAGHCSQTVRLMSAFLLKHFHLANSYFPLLNRIRDRGCLQHRNVTLDAELLFILITPNWKHKSYI